MAYLEDSAAQTVHRWQGGTRSSTVGFILTMGLVEHRIVLESLQVKFDLLSLTHRIISNIVQFACNSNNYDLFCADASAHMRLT